MDRRDDTEKVKARLLEGPTTKGEIATIINASNEMHIRSLIRSARIRIKRKHRKTVVFDHEDMMYKVVPYGESTG